ncbi:MAG: DUF6933 domain-containing protein [Gemmatimonadales bacterium]
MVILRPTSKLHRSLPPAEEPAAPSTTALGAWYVGPLKVDYQPLLLLLSSTSLLAIVTPARQVSTLPERLPELVGVRLRRLQVPAQLIEAETAAMVPVLVARTRDRSVLGTLVDFAKTIPLYLPVRSWDKTTLPFLEGRLAETPCRCSGRDEDVIWPGRDALRLLWHRWQPVGAQ